MAEKIIRLTCCLLLAATATGTFTARGAGAAIWNTPPVKIPHASWVGTDALGRKLPGYKQVGPPKPRRWVGLFYWQWHTHKDRWGKNYNVTDFLKKHPGFKDFQAYPPGGPKNPTWYWGKPLFGYYRSTDPWVIRRHLAMIADAGVDFLFLDYTNGQIYNRQLAVLLRVAQAMKRDGVQVPKLVFFLNYQPEWKIEALYKKWYLPGKYKNMWFMWHGKPLIMAAKPTTAKGLKNPALLPAIENYFTFHKTWAFQSAKQHPHEWRFMDNTPQRPALDSKGHVEQMVVSKSVGGPIWKNMQIGGVSCVPGFVPHYNKQWLSPERAWGLFFQRQWHYARKVHAPILLVTGWNEWTASVWEQPGVVFLGRKTKKGQDYIVDEFNQDFDRDLEPMTGGYGDDYYWQFLEEMRRYKGLVPPGASSGPALLHMRKKGGNGFAQWAPVRPIFHGTVGDVVDRNFPGAVPHSHYVNDSARNDIALAQVARNRHTLFFHAKTAAPLSPAAGKNWMMLLLNTHSAARPAWHGYDFLINRYRKDGRCSLEENIGGKYAWKLLGWLPLYFRGKNLELSVPRRLVDLRHERRPLTFDFKWADNIPAKSTIMDFYSDGDVAPDSRFNFRYAPPRANYRDGHPAGIKHGQATLRMIQPAAKRRR